MKSLLKHFLNVAVYFTIVYVLSTLLSTFGIIPKGNVLYSSILITIGWSIIYIIKFRKNRDSR